MLNAAARSADTAGMWLWVTIGWSLVALVAAALHHRFRRATGSHPPEVAAFVLRLETELAEAHPDVQFLGMLPDRLACLLRVRGQETPVSLHHAFRHAEAFPDAFSRMVANLVGDLGEAALDRVDDIDFAAAAPLILPQVRSRAWLEAQGCFGDSALAHRPMNDELVTVYVVDDVNCMLFICREHMRRWRKSEEDLHNLALANLARLGSHDLRHLGQSEQPTLLHSGDGFDAARVLLLEPAEGLLVAIPDRDTLWVGAEHGHSLEQLMATTEAIAQQAAHPVSPTLWRFTDGRLQAWKP